VNLRGQILIGTVLMAVLPLVLAVRLIATTVEARFTELDTARVANQLAVVRDDLDRQGTEVGEGLDALAATILADNSFRLAVGGTRPDLDSYLLDFAPRQMSLMNLDLLQIQDARGKVLSSGHFPHAYGQLDPQLPVLLARAPEGRALISARTAEAGFLALARTRPVSLGEQTYHLIGGRLVDADRLSALDREGDLGLAVVWPEGRLTTSEVLANELDGEADILAVEYRLRHKGCIVQSVYLPLVREGELGDARLLVAHDRAALHQLLRSLNVRLGLVLLLVAGLAVLLATLLAGRVSRPLHDLAARTADLDLDRLDVEFHSTRRDEVGSLTRLLGEMTGRLRTSVSRLRSAEQKVTMGEMARQVNHDIRNGITPLRNVLRHLSQVAREEPEALASVFAERRETLENGLAYLEDLATHYAKLSPGRAAEPCRLAGIVAAALNDPGTGPAVRLVNAVPSNLPPIMADPVSLRRICDNLVRNAIESLPPEGGSVTVDATVDEDPRTEEMRILVTFSDTGEGIAPEDMEAVFNDFFTTRPHGTGLGLSNVRRLIGDCGGSIRVKSERGRGTTFTLSFPLPGTGA
jgi:signal transduction histidine kinase